MTRVQDLVEAALDASGYDNLTGVDIPLTATTSNPTREGTVMANDEVPGLDPVKRIVDAEPLAPAPWHSTT